MRIPQTHVAYQCEPQKDILLIHENDTYIGDSPPFSSHNSMHFQQPKLSIVNSSIAGMIIKLCFFNLHNVSMIDSHC